MVDDLLVAQEPWLPQYGDAVAAAKRRAKGGERLPTKSGYVGAARLHTKSVEEMEHDRDAARRLAAEADKAKERPAAS